MYEILKTKEEVEKTWSKYNMYIKQNNFENFEYLDLLCLVEDVPTCCHCGEQCL